MLAECGARPSLIRFGTTNLKSERLRSMRSAFALFMAPIVVIVACSSNPPPAPTTAPVASSSSSAAPVKAGIPREAFAEKLAKVVCDATAPCCKGRYIEDACNSELLGKLEWKERVAKTKLYNAEHAEKCLDEAKAQAAKCDAARDTILHLPSCAALLTGPGKTGDPCEENTDCVAVAKGRAFCWTGSMADEPGRCAVSAPPELGAACFSPQATTQDKKQLVFSECHDDAGMYCDPKTTKCIARPKAGGSCSDSNQCEDGAICSGAAKCKSLLGASCKRSTDCASKQACISGTCAPGLKLGDKCDDFSDCAEGICLGGSKVCGPWAAAFLCAAPKGK